MNQITAIPARQSEFDVDPLFLGRWSPRAFAETPVSEAELLTVLEAAHWAPSAFNAQPWRFIYARRGDAHWDKLLEVLVDFNRGWAQHAGALVVIVSKTHNSPEDGSAPAPIYSHSFDAGAAWGQLSLQARLLGLYAHGMTGLNFDKAPELLGIPEGYRIEAAVALGHIGDKASLPDFLRDREVPSPRRPLAEVAFAGTLVA